MPKGKSMPKGMKGAGSAKGVGTKGSQPPKSTSTVTGKKTTKPGKGK